MQVDLSAARCCTIDCCVFCGNTLCILSAHYPSAVLAFDPLACGREVQVNQFFIFKDDLGYDKRMCWDWVEIHIKFPEVCCDGVNCTDFW